MKKRLVFHKFVERKKNTDWRKKKPCKNILYNMLIGKWNNGTGYIREIITANYR